MGKFKFERRTTVACVLPGGHYVMSWLGMARDEPHLLVLHCLARREERGVPGKRRWVWFTGRSLAGATKWLHSPPPLTGSRLETDTW